MKNIMMATAQVTCGLSKGPCSHIQTWWWIEEVAEEKSTEAWKEYKKSKQNAKKVIFLAKGKKLKECASNLKMTLTVKMVQ